MVLLCSGRCSTGDPLSAGSPLRILGVEEKPKTKDAQLRNPRTKSAPTLMGKSWDIIELLSDGFPQMENPKEAPTQHKSKNPSLQVHPREMNLS